ncbi:hypothetical protein AX17_005473 [Amanita inopinata Kibby_2008]|nr:hypothetical protein AX17_005473 [Amanita inopinata Kibby_2008]
MFTYITAGIACTLAQAQALYFDSCLLSTTTNVVGGTSFTPPMLSPFTHQHDAHIRHWHQHLCLEQHLAHEATEHEWWHSFREQQEALVELQQIKHCFAREELHCRQVEKALEEDRRQADTLFFCLESTPALREPLLFNFTNLELVFRFGGETALNHYGKFLSQEERNKLTHSLNGNGSILANLTALDGSNYPVWSQTMQAYLKLASLWSNICTETGNLPTPVWVDNDTSMHYPYNKAVSDNNAKLDTALGSIVLKLNPAIKSLVKDITTPRVLWKFLKECYKTPGLAQIFGDFCQVLGFKLSGNQNPEVEITKLIINLAKLEAQSVAILDLLQVMILLNAIPAKWDNLVSTYLSTKKQTEMSVSKVKGLLVAEFHHGTTMKGVTPKANQLSGVSHKKKDPNWKGKGDKKEKKEKKEGEGLGKPDSDKKKQCGGRHAPKVKAKEAMEPSQVLSFATLTIVTTHATVDPHRVAQPQQYHGVPTKSNWESVTVTPLQALSRIEDLLVKVVWNFPR